MCLLDICVDSFWWSECSEFLNFLNGIVCLFCWWITRVWGYILDSFFVGYVLRIISTAYKLGLSRESECSEFWQHSGLANPVSAITLLLQFYEVTLCMWSVGAWNMVCGYCSSFFLYSVLFFLPFYSFLSWNCKTKFSLIVFIFPTGWMATGRIGRRLG